jgi:hypothetical protein
VSNWITPADVATWLKMPGTLTADQQTSLQECCDTAEESIRWRVQPAHYAAPDRTLRLCAIGIAMHRYLSRETPGGYSNVGDLAVVRVPGRNQLVEEAIWPYLDLAAGVG